MASERPRDPLTLTRKQRSLKEVLPLGGLRADLVVLERELAERGEALEPVDRTRLVHSKYAEFAAMVQAKTDRSLETRAEIAGLEGLSEEARAALEEKKRSK